MSESEIALKTMSVHSKALCIINEYVHIHRDFSTLAVFIEELSVDQIEWEEIILEIRAQLQAANYEESAINYLVKGLRQNLVDRARTGQVTQVRANGTLNPPKPHESFGRAKSPSSPIPSFTQSQHQLLPPSPVLQSGGNGARRGSLSGSTPERSKDRKGAFTFQPRQNGNLLAQTPAVQHRPPGNMPQFGRALQGINSQGIKPIHRPTVLIAEGVHLCV